MTQKDLLPLSAYIFTEFIRIISILFSDGLPKTPSGSLLAAAAGSAAKK